jgi:uncharacterized DUF497 family protein
MDYEWDEAKRLTNLKKHGVDFAQIEEFDWAATIEWVDESENYGEERLIALGPFQGRIYSVAYTERRGRTRIISFRKATRKEIERYEKEKGRSSGL